MGCWTPTRSGCCRTRSGRTPSPLRMKPEAWLWLKKSQGWFRIFGASETSGLESVTHSNECLHVELCGQGKTLSDGLQFPEQLQQVNLLWRGRRNEKMGGMYAAQRGWAMSRSEAWAAAGDQVDVPGSWHCCHKPYLTEFMILLQCSWPVWSVLPPEPMMMFVSRVAARHPVSIHGLNCHQGQCWGPQNGLTLEARRMSLVLAVTRYHVEVFDPCSSKTQIRLDFVVVCFCCLFVLFFIFLVRK